MAWNGSGTFNLNPTYSPEVNGTTIDAVRYNGLLTDVAAGITACLAKNGENVPTANLPMGGFKITGLGAPTANGDALAYGSPMGAISGTTGTFSGAVSGTTGTFSGNVQMASANGGQLAGLRNKIINGDMNISQRGTSFAAIANAAYSLDRWQTGNSSSAVITVSQQADVPSSNEFQNSLRYTITTADTVIATSDHALVQQQIEGYNVRNLIGKTFTLSFWVRSSKTGIHCFSMGNSGNDRQYVSEYTISAANTWEYKTITIAGGLITAGTWNWTTGTGVTARWALAAGSTYQTATVGSWIAGTNLFATSNQVNCLDTISNIFAITGVQFEPGPVATPFEQRPIGMELALCQRYFELVNYPSFYVPNTTATTMYVPVFYKVTKRATPTSVVLPSSTNAGFNSSGATITPTTWTTNSISVDSVSINIGNASLGGVASSSLTVSSEL